MKKFKYLALLAAILTLGACSYEFKENFDDNATDRYTQEMSRVEKILKNANNGWIVYYFADTSYGGFNLYLDFEGDSVTAMSEISVKSTTIPASAKSHWKLEQSQGVVLSFDEYNDVIHYFSDPINVDGIGSRGYGLEGDHEWRVISCTEELIVLRGKKHESRIEMVPLPANYTPEQYFDELAAVIADMNAANIYTTIDDEIIKTTKNASYNVFDFVLPQENGTTVTYRRPYIYKLDGIHFYSPLEYNGHTIKGFTYIPMGTAFPELDDENVQLHLEVLPINEQLVKSTWWIASYDDLGTVATAIYKPIVDATWNGEREECAQCYIGGVSSQSTDYIYWCYQSGNYYSYARASYTLVGENAITIEAFADAGINTNYPWYVTNYQFNNMANVFNSTFDIEYDNLKAPSWVKLTDRANSGKVITLKQGLKSYPFGTH